MINRARRALPGMVMTLLLSTPAWAASGRDATTAAVATGLDAKSAPAAQKPALRAARMPTTETRTASIHAGPVHWHGHAKLQLPSPALAKAASGHTIRRASPRVASGSVGTSVDRSLVEDATLWRDPAIRSAGQQTGMASWYGGSRWQGHRTTSGSHYDQDELTAAHATLPLGTRVKVVRNDGRGSVIVTINDRPGTRTRIIDLSRAAAKELGILDAGVAMVTLQPM